MTQEEMLITIGKIWTKVNEMDVKLEQLEDNRLTVTKEIEGIRKLLTELKDDLHKGTFQQPYEICGGYKELHEECGEIDKRLLKIEEDVIRKERKQNWRLGIMASVIGSLLVAATIAFFSYVLPEIYNDDIKDVIILLERLIERIEK